MRHKKARFTGERPTLEEGQRYLIHESLCRYNFAKSYCKNKKVLDIGCGEGFGTAILADYARLVIGIDYFADSIDYANAAFNRPNLKFMNMDCAELNFKDESFDLISGFEIIEHLRNPGLFLCETSRVLKDDGIIILSTMQRHTRWSSGNPFHIKEYSFDEFKNILSKYYKNLEFFGEFCIRKINPLQRLIMGLDSHNRLRRIRQKFNFNIISKIERSFGSTPPQEVSEKDFIVKNNHLLKASIMIAVCYKNFNK